MKVVNPNISQSRKSYSSFRFLFAKVNEKGVVWCIKAILLEMIRKLLKYAISDNRRKKLEVMSYKVFPCFRDWVEFISYIKRTFLLSETYERVLGIMDFDLQNFTIGDSVIFQENLLVLRERNKFNNIDVCIVDDSSPEWKKRKDKRAVYRKKEFVLQTMILNPNIDNVYRFNSRSHYNDFRLRELHKYLYFPNRRDQFHCDHRVLRKFWEDMGYLPKMSADPQSLGWARRIIDTHIHPAKLLVVHIRNSVGIKTPEDWHEEMAVHGSNENRRRSPAAKRDSNLPMWGKFFERLDQNKFKVICICQEEEIVPEWRDKGLVKFSKDLGSNLIKDFALIQLSFVSLFPPSGMFEFAFYSHTPCLVLNMPVGYWKNKNKEIYQLNGDLNDFSQYNYQTPYQKIIWEKDTFETIGYHFRELVAKLEAAQDRQDSQELIDERNDR